MLAMLSQRFQAKLIWVTEVAVGETVDKPKRCDAVEPKWQLHFGNSDGGNISTEVQSWNSYPYYVDRKDSCVCTSQAYSSSLPNTELTTIAITENQLKGRTTWACACVSQQRPRNRKSQGG